MSGLVSKSDAERFVLPALPPRAFPVLEVPPLPALLDGSETNLMSTRGIAKLEEKTDLWRYRCW